VPVNANESIDWRHQIPVADGFGLLKYFTAAKEPRVFG
jgi:hypothetical protein